MNYLTKCSLFIELYLNEDTEKPGGIGTAFLVQSAKKDVFLVTNWHCVTGINPETNENMSKNGVIHPEIMDVHFLKKGSEREWVIKRIRLLDHDGNKLYTEHPNGPTINVVIIKIDNFDDVDLYFMGNDVSAELFDIEITNNVSIIGFPKGISTGGKFPIWKTGHIASEFELNHDNKPMFLIDASTREGMSGSPVYCINGLSTKVGSQISMFHAITPINFLGIYAGRLGVDTEIGRVFRLEALDEVIGHYNRLNS